MSSYALFAMAGFASGWMLLWAGAGAIPIVIHLLMRRRQVSVPWAAMQLLMDVIEKEARRVRLEQLILLCVRVAILCTLACALARPYWDSNPTSDLAEEYSQPKLWILGIDTSYSMAYRHVDVSRFQDAKEQAIELIQTSAPGDAFSLIEFGAPSKALIWQPTFDREAMLAELRKLHRKDTGCDALSGLRLVHDVVQWTRESARFPRKVQAVVFSDMGRESWEDVLTENDSETLEQLSTNSHLKLVSLAQRNTENLAITSLDVSANRPHIDGPIECVLRIENFSDSPTTQMPVQFQVDEQTLQSKFIDLGPRESQSLSFSWNPESSGFKAITVQIPPDRLTADNARTHIVQVRDHERVLLAESRQGDARLIRMSLEASKNSKKTEFRTIPAIELSALDLSAWDIVVLSDVNLIDGRVWQKLKRYVEDGGSLLCCFGPNAPVDAWNQNESAKELLGYQFTSVSDEGTWDINALDYASPIVAPFAGFPDSGLLTTPIFRYWQIQVLASNRLFVDLGFTNGDPLLVRNRIGRGSVASILSTPMSGVSQSNSVASWNAMAAWPSFVPLMQQTATVILEADEREFNLQTAELIRGTLDDREPDTQIRLVAPNGSESIVLAEPKVGSNGRIWEFGKTQMRGVYQAHLSSGTVVPFAVNIDPAESSLDSVPDTAFPTVNPSNLPENRSVSPSTNSSDMLARWLLGLLFLLLVAESSLAWWIGRRVG